MNAKILSALALTCSVAAHAHYACVSTASELRQAIIDGSDGGANNGEDNVIALMPGTYLTNTGPFDYRSTAATGYVSIEACGPNVSDPSLRVLDGHNATKVLRIRNKGSEVIVMGVTIQNGNSTDGGGGLDINAEGGFNQNVNLDRCIIRNNFSGSLGGGFYISADGAGHITFITNNLIYGNSTSGNGGAGELFSNGGTATILQNTVTQNTTTSSGGNAAIGGIVNEVIGSSAVRNNILWANTASGMYFSSSAQVTYNDYGSIAGAMPNASSVGNVSVTPGFVDAAAHDFRLAATSPLLGFTPIPNSQNIDLVGNAYPATGFADIGAYEDTVFKNGFDP